MTLSALLDTIVASACAPMPIRAWTTGDLAFLEDNLPVLGYAGVAQRLGRTMNAVKIIQVRRQIPAPSRRPGFYTCQQAARILGVDIHALSRLERRGEIRFVTLPGVRAIRQISRVSLWVWAIHPNHWIYFKPARVKDIRLRRLIALRQARWGDAWWTTGQVAEHYGVANSNTVTAAIYRGRLKAVRWGNWYVKRSDALGCPFTPGKGMTGIAWSARADAFLLRARDEWNLSFHAIGRLMKWPMQRACYRYGVLKCNDEP
jgi:hypothetical protein